MRASPRRSFAWLSAPALLVATAGVAVGLGACTPPLSLDDRPPPCVAGYRACDTIGLCIREARECPGGPTIRQGGNLIIGVPGAGPNDAVEASSPASSLTPTVRRLDGAVVVHVRAEHGAPIGDRDQNEITITTALGGQPYTRKIKIFVSSIVVRPSGSDTGAGTTAHPFRTLFKAASVAGAGDTISLHNTVQGGDSQAGETRLVTLPSGVTLQGEAPIDHSHISDPKATIAHSILSPRLALEGSVTFSNLEIVQPLAVVAPGARVELVNTDANEGVSVVGTAKNATLSIASGSHVSSKATKSPLFVEADGATLTISGMDTIIDNIATGLTGSPDDVPPVISLTGYDQKLNVSDPLRIQNVAGAVAIHAGGKSTLSLNGRDGKMRILGRVVVLDSESTATIRNTGIEPGRGEGGFVFKGATMLIADSTLGHCGLVQDRANSHIVLRVVSFSEYPRFGVQLRAGKLDLGTSLEEGDNSFAGKWDESTPPPVALQVDADEGMASVTSSATTFDSINPGPCPPIVGPGQSVDKMLKQGIYSVVNKNVITFY